MRKLTFVFALLLALCLVTPGQAGSPPKGGGQIRECQVIDEPGPYIVVNNLPGPDGLLTGGEAGFVAAGDCLAIDSENVSIDGQGFRMTGNGLGAGIRNNIIVAPYSQHHIEIRNLSIWNFEGGVNLINPFFAVIENVSAIDNDSAGITLSGGQSNRVVNNVSVSNGTVGINVTTSRSIVANNIANGNSIGISVAHGSVITGNTANSNTLQGIQVTCPALVESNVATENLVDLQHTGGGCTSVNNVAPVVSP